MRTITLRSGERTVEGSIDAEGRVKVGDERFTVTPMASGVYSVSDGESRWQVAVAGPAERRWVSVNGAADVIEIEAGGPGTRRRRSTLTNTMTAPMPATVVSVLVTPGQQVAEGETVLVLEAMKMEIAVRAPRSGTVSKVNCTPGELVQPGVTLVDLE